MFDIFFFPKNFFGKNDFIVFPKLKTHLVGLLKQE